MAFYISKSRQGWKLTDDDWNIIEDNMKSKREAEDEMVSLSAAQNIKVGGEKGLPENYRPALAKDVPEGRACGNCKFFNEEKVSPDGTQAWCTLWDDWADGGYYCNKWEGKGDAVQD
jgi:hypothetical protein